jgi:uncharacterized protein
MSSLAVKLPITKDSIDGFAMIKDFRTLIKQNFKMLLLTIPGERVMAPSFGVGISRFLFSTFSQSTFNEIESEILKQTAIYLPVISIHQINFVTDQADMNRLNISIEYSIPTLNVKELLEFTI